MTNPRLEYHIVTSPRAKHLRLRVSLQRGLEVVVPRGYDTDRVPALLDRKKHWIRAAIERINENRKFVEPEPVWRPPTYIKLEAVGRIWHVDRIEGDMSWASVVETGRDRLRLQGAIDDRQACEAAMQRWLMRRAHEDLVPWLREVSQQVGMPFRRAYVKRQRTRWASCSRAGAISINARLLFLDRELVRYVFIHELCHTVRMDHSPKFWLLLRSNIPDYRRLDKNLRTAWRRVPTWAGRCSGGTVLH